MIETPKIPFAWRHLVVKILVNINVCREIGWPFPKKKKNDVIQRSGKRDKMMSPGGKLTALYATQPKK
jgi:hypothetical protein